MKKTSYITILLSIVSLICFGQHPSDYVSNHAFNIKYLEHLIKVKIDSVRKAHDCKPLVNDSILYIAAKHHSDYMIKRNKLTHKENDLPATKTPQQRAEYYGAINYSVGENVLETPYGIKLENKKGKTFHTSNYEGLSSSIVDGWVNSPPHYQNMINPKYQITGLTVSINTEKNKLYSCQKFATVKYKYEFEEPSSMFPYSNYIPRKLQKNFDNIPKELLNHKHQWKIKHGDKEACKSCMEVIPSKPQLTLRFEKNSFILRVENSEYVKNLIRDRKDGFAVEIVPFEDYACGNPSYYTKPSRRNYQCQLNDRILEPMYRDDLFKGYRKRKTNKEVKFVGYMLKNKDVPFFKRYYQRKLESFSSEYFEIKLAKLPKDLYGYWNHNLVYLQNKRICHIDYFTGYCGGTYKDSTEVNLLPLDTIANYNFTPDTQILHFVIPFEKNKAQYSEKDIAPFIESISGLDFTIDSIHLKAFSSVEGDSIANLKLQTTRAKNIIQVFQEHQTDSITTTIVTDTDWKHFYDEVNKSTKWRGLAKLDKKILAKRLNNGLADSLENILEKERRAEIDLYCSINLSETNLTYYITKEYDDYCDSLKRIFPKSGEAFNFLNQLNKLYKFAHKMVVENKADTSVLVNLPLPNYYNLHKSLCEKIILYGYHYPTAFNKNFNWKSNREKVISAIQADNNDPVSPEFLLSYSTELAEKLNSKTEVSQKEVQQVFDYLSQLESFYSSHIEASDNIDKLNFNLNMILLNNTFINKPSENSAAAYKSINNILSYYTKRNLMNDSLAYKLAKMSIYYLNNSLASIILQPYTHHEYILLFSLPLNWNHPDSNDGNAYAEYLLELSKTLENKKWCNLFLNECTIPFQTFDHEELRNKFCEKCLESNDFFINVLNY